MKNLSALLFVLLLCSLQLVSSAPVVFHTPDCCTSVSDVEIPLKRVLSYKLTSSSCAGKAIVFETVAGKQICVNPDAVWVSSHITSVDSRKNTTVKTTAPQLHKTATTTPTMLSYSNAATDADSTMSSANKQLSGPFAPNFSPCCPSVTRKKLPLRHIVSYSWTSSRCSIKAVVFNTVKRKMVCVDPASAWLVGHMKAVDQRKKVPATD